MSDPFLFINLTETCVAHLGAARTVRRHSRRSDDSAARCGAGGSRGSGRGRRCEGRRRSWSAGGSAVPVRLWVAQAFTQCDQPVSLLCHQIKHVACEILCRLLVDIVCNSLEIVLGWITRVDHSTDSVLRILNQIRCYVVIVYWLLARLMPIRVGVEQL